MLRVYLDMKGWIGLAQAREGHPAGKGLVDILRLAGEGVQLGLVSFPISLCHYMELGNRRGEPACRLTYCA
jgi:hypothetical protein